MPASSGVADVTEGVKETMIKSNETCDGCPSSLHIIVRNRAGETGKVEKLCAFHWLRSIERKPRRTLQTSEPA